MAGAAGGCRSSAEVKAVPRELVAAEVARRAVEAGKPGLKAAVRAVRPQLVVAQLQRAPALAAFRQSLWPGWRHFFSPAFFRFPGAREGLKGRLLSPGFRSRAQRARQT